MHSKDQLAFYKRYASRRSPYRFARLFLCLLLIITLLPDAGLTSASTHRPAITATTPDPIFDRVTTDEDTPVSIDVLANDLPADDDSLEIVAVGKPQSGTAVIADDNILYTPKPGFSGNDSFFYSIHNGDPANTRQATVQ